MLEKIKRFVDNTFFSHSFMRSIVDLEKKRRFKIKLMWFFFIISTLYLCVLFMSVFPVLDFFIDNITSLSSMVMVAGGIIGFLTLMGFLIYLYLMFLALNYSRDSDLLDILIYLKKMNGDE